MKKIYILVLSVVVIIIVLLIAEYYILKSVHKNPPEGSGITENPPKEKEAPQPKVSNFKECLEAGNLVIETYPLQCRHGDQVFTEDIGNELEKSNLIRVNTPRPNEIIQNPFTIIGEARGTWFFGGSFPVVLTDWDGKIIGQGVATAESDWMTEDFVTFKATINFEAEENRDNKKGMLILRKDNPSGLPQNDDALEIPVTFTEKTEFSK